MIAKKKRVGKYIIHLDNKLLTQNNDYACFNSQTGEQLRARIISKEDSIIFQQFLVQLDPFEIVAYSFQLNKIRYFRNNPNLIKYIILQSSNNYFMIHEKTPNQTLRDFLFLKKIIEQQEAIAIFKQILEGYKQCVVTGFIHGHLKLKNIYINKDGEIKIGGLGVSSSSLLKSFLSLASSFYRFQILKLPYSQKRTISYDIWCLGEILYELIYGKPIILKQSFNQFEHIQDPYLFIQFPSQIKVSELTLDILKQCFQFNKVNSFTLMKIYNKLGFKVYFPLYFPIIYCARELRLKILQLNLDLKQILNTHLFFSKNEQKLVSKQRLIQFLAQMSQNKYASSYYMKFFIDDTSKRLNLEQNQFFTYQQCLNLLKTVDLTQKLSQKSSEFRKVALDLKKKVNQQQQQKSLEIVYEEDYNSLQQKLTQDLFNKLVLKVDPQASQNSLKILFKYFKKSNKQQYTKLDYIKFIYKIASKLCPFK